jgi:AraC-like DNA-binding protein
MPQNILIFHRTSRTVLQHGSTFRHQHHRYVLITAVHKGGEIGVDARTHPIGEGQSLLVLPFQAHWYVNLSSAAIHWVFVTFEHEKDARLETLRDQGALRLGAGDLTPLRDLLRAWQTPREYDTVRPRLSLWLHALATRARQRGPALAPAPAATSDGEWLAGINRFVFENREVTPSLSEIAHRLRVSASLLRSRFRRITGKSVGRYVRELKLQYGCELLHDTSLSITEVAQRCGYDSVFSFSRAFHKTYALSPSSYRKTYQIGR